MKIAFFKEILRGPGQDARFQATPDTYNNISNVVIYPGGIVVFLSEKNEIICCNNKFKIIATPEEWKSVSSETKGF